MAELILYSTDNALYLQRKGKYMLGKKILSTKCTPEVSLDPYGIIKISGRSISENGTGFSEQIDEWIDEYMCNPAELTTVDISFEYFNAVNFKIYFNLLNKIGSLRLINKKYTVNWYYEEGDEDILEKGEDISSALDIPFNFIMISDPLLPGSDSLKLKTSVS
jgi:SiaC family regulatory phosphoprotein